MATKIDLQGISYGLFQEAETIYKALQANPVTSGLSARKDALAARITACEKEAIPHAENVAGIYSHTELENTFKNIQFAQVYLSGKNLSSIKNERDKTPVIVITEFFDKFTDSFSSSPKTPLSRSTSAGSTTRTDKPTVSTATPPPTIPVKEKEALITRPHLYVSTSSPTKLSSDCITIIAILLTAQKSAQQKATAINTYLQNFPDYINNIYQAILDQSQDPEKGSDQSWAQAHIGDNTALLLNILLDTFPTHIPINILDSITPVTEMRPDPTVHSSTIFTGVAKCLSNKTMGMAKKAQEINDYLEQTSETALRDIYDEIIARSTDPDKETDVQWAMNHIADRPEILLDVLIAKLPFNDLPSPSLSTTEVDDVPFQPTSLPSIDSPLKASEEVFPTSLEIVKIMTQISTYIAQPEWPTPQKAVKINSLLNTIAEKAQLEIYTEIVKQSKSPMEGTDIQWAKEHIADKPELLLNILMEFPVIR